MRNFCSWPMRRAVGRAHCLAGMKPTRPATPTAYPPHTAFKMRPGVEVKWGGQQREEEPSVGVGMGAFRQALQALPVLWHEQSRLATAQKELQAQDIPATL